MKKTASSRRARREVRIGVVGVGIIGLAHADRVARTPRARLAALCSRNPAKASLAAERGCAFFTDHRELLRSGACDAVLVATPHYDHVPIGVDALNAGLHVLLEKPVAVDLAGAQRLAAAAAGRRRLVAAVMFQMRTDPRFVRLRDLLLRGRLGTLQRVTWILTDWFRPDAYYASAPWRGTWAGEGGGVLVNQCPHQLDLLGWLFGPPERVQAVCGFGRRHAIEVEDEVTAVLEYPGGCTGTFITSTGEAPGTNRLEIAGTRGRAVLEGSSLVVTTNATPSDEYCRNGAELFGRPAVQAAASTLEPAAAPHEAVIRNFVDAILGEVPPVAPLADGVRQVELANAMLYSAVRGRAVSLPLDAKAFGRCHRRLVLTKGRGKRSR
ncbi:MAG: Gfo/Idh/MocA family oxidoreductase [Lentisphaerae bacterium]|nr:Gfo/Idh/MocA family oxidoreductase [Lentisphaerota bacterium]